VPGETAGAPFDLDEVLRALAHPDRRRFVSA